MVCGALAVRHWGLSVEASDCCAACSAAIPGSDDARTLHSCTDEYAGPLHGGPASRCRRSAMLGADTAGIASGKSDLEDAREWSKS